MICRYCGKEFEPKKRGRKNSGFCCKKCADNWRQHNSTKPPKFIKVCEQCGKEFGTNRENQKFCSPECNQANKRTGRTIHTKSCLYCGEEFQTIDKNQKYCSPGCAARHAGDQRRGEYFCEYCGKPRHSDHPNRNRFCFPECATKFKVIKYLPIKLQKEKEKEEKRLEQLTKTCPQCGNTFIANVAHQKYCSPECRYQESLDKVHQRNVENFVPIVSTCKECSKVFTTTFDHRSQLFCSEECSIRYWKKLYKQNRKIQIREAYVEPVNLWDLYNRDYGICSICGLPVPDSSEPSNIWAATVDHIVPLSLGGEHSTMNCQLSHRICNCLKGQENDTEIDWGKRLIEEPGRWNEKLDDLWYQLGEEIKVAK